MSKDLRKKALITMSSSSGSSVDIQADIAAATSTGSDSDATATTVSKAEWMARSLANHADVVELLERSQPLSGHKTFGRSYSAARTASRQAINHQHVTRLIERYLQSQGLMQSKRRLERESGVHLGLDDTEHLSGTLLHDMLACGISDIATVFDPSEREYDMGNAILPVYDYSPPAVTRTESEVEVDTNIWDDPPENPSNLVTQPTADRKAFVIRYGTFNKIIEFLTSETPKEFDVRNIFLATYSSYTTTDKLLDKLIQRCHAPASVPLEQVKQIQMRVVLILKSWLENHPEDFSENALGRLSEFIDSMGNEKLAKGVRQAISRMQTKGTEREHEMHDAPDPIVPKNIFSQSLTIGEVPAEELARQLTLIDQDLYASLTMAELLAYSKLGEFQRTTKTGAMINRFNSLVKWVAGSILALPTIKERAQQIERYVEVAKHLREMHSFNSLLAIVTGLSHGAISRLQHTFGAVSNVARGALRDLSMLCDPMESFARYRECFAASKPPCIPFIGAHLQELLYVDTSQPDKVDGMINFEKRVMLYRVIIEGIRYQCIRYRFLAIHQISVFVRRFSNLLPEEELYKRSFDVEPKGISAVELVKLEQTRASKPPSSLGSSQSSGSLLTTSSTS